MRKTTPFILVTLLLAFSITSCDSSKPKSVAEHAVSETPKEVKAGNLKLGYINTDTLSARFELIKDMEDEIVAERMKMENQYQAMVQDLQKDYTDAQEGAASLSQEALAILQQKLQQKEQQIMQQKSMMENQLMEFEQEKSSFYLEKVQGFLSEYAQAEGYDMIYGFNGLGNVLYIDKTYDLTDIIIDSLNNQYSTDKMQASKSK